MRTLIAAAGAALLLAGTALAQGSGSDGTDAKADARGSATKTPQSPVERAIGAPAETPACPQGVPTTYETEPKSSVNCMPPAADKPATATGESDLGASISETKD
jgi:hypothetical protein